GSGNGVDARGRFDPGRLDPGTRERVRERLGIPTGATVVGYVGRIVRDKGVVELVQAWSELRETHPDLHLLIVGPFEPQDPVPEAVARRLREDPRIHPVGLDWNTPPLYTAMDVVALPSYREGFPNVPLEAAAMELAVVATRIPGCVDAVVDGCTGTLVPPRDSCTRAGRLRTRGHLERALRGISAAAAAAGQDATHAHCRRPQGGRGGVHDANAGEERLGKVGRRRWGPRYARQLAGRSSSA